jgi:two-component system, OmpR family, sensor histidine kinase KdpD
MQDSGERRPGRLTIFLGAAPGVGKTYAMLEAARLRRRDGADVVIGLIETHGRQATEELVQDFELIPRRGIEYRGHVIEEMDIEAILQRSPDLVLVDELAHSNIPGTRNAKRYLDILELIEAGIDVFTTLNVQHIESLGTTVAKITWARVRETVPNRVLDMADEIEVVDLPASDLVRRIDEGKVARGVRGELKRGTFFSDRNLTALRQLALQFAKKRPVRSILVPFDGSESALRAVQHVIALARAGHCGSTLLLNVQLPATKSAIADTKPEAAGMLVLEKASRLLEAGHIPCRCQIVTGKPAEEIARTAERHQVDLIVMGATGIGTLAGRLLGSVAFGVARDASAPVTLVK